MRIEEHIKIHTIKLLEKHYCQVFIQKRKPNAFLSFKETSSARYYKIIFIDSSDSLTVIIAYLPNGKHTKKRHFL